MPTKPGTVSQRMREMRGGRAADDRAYNLRRMADPESAELERMRKTQAWRDARDAVIQAEPLCRTCRSRGIVRPAQDVDHIVPARADRERFLDLANLQPLCRTCHNTKTAAERHTHGA